MKSKPLTEVLAQLYVGERFKLNPDETPWVNMSDEARGVELGAMAEVVRTLGLFGWEVFENEKGIGVRRIQVVDETRPKKKKPHDPLDPTGLGAPEKNEGTVQTAKQRGFTGIPCDACGSINTVRNGKCLLCMDCHSSGECG